MRNRTIVVAILTTAILGSLYLFSSPSFPSSTFQMSPTSKPPVDALVITLSQTSSNPPTLKITVRNEHSATLTFLEWDTPLDKQAFSLGVFNVTDAAKKEVEIPRLMINRKLPPTKEALVELASGAELSREMVLDKPWVPKDGKFKIKAEGRWKAIWEKATEGVLRSELKELGGGEGAMTGEFRSEEIIMEV